ncbi:MAG: GGDEF-domain containing protein [Herbaspirillum sp.]|nr:GGDEF-domain containing protein [Herbaspirillum sp.]
MRAAFHRQSVNLKNLFKDGKGLTLGFALLCCILLGVIWFTTFARVEIEKKLAVESSIADSKNVAAIVSLNLDEVLSRALLYGRIGRSLLEGDAKVTAYLNPLASGDSAYLRFAVFDADGKLAYSSARQRSEPEFSQLINAVGASAPLNARTATMIIWPPEKTDRYSWRVPLLIPLRGRDDHVEGFFAAILDLGYFLNTYKEVSLNSGSRIEILNRKGLQLAELSGSTLSGGGKAFAARAYTAFLSGTQVESVIPAMAAQDGIQTIGALRKLEKYPLAIAVSREPDHVFGKLARAQRQYFTQSSMVSLAAILLTFGLTSIARRRKKLYDRLTYSEREKSGLINALEKEKTRAIRWPRRTI